jgi:hypothetical protein
MSLFCSLALLAVYSWPGPPRRASGAVGSFYLALLPGVMAQWLIDPEHAPSGRDLADALRTIVAVVGPVDAAPGHPG